MIFFKVLPDCEDEDLVELGRRSELMTMAEKLDCAFASVPAPLRKTMIGWAGWGEQTGTRLWVFREEDQRYFQPLEVDALFRGEEKKRRNKWLTAVEGEPLTLRLYTLLGVRWDIDCHGKRPEGVRVQWDTQLGVPLEDSKKADYISVQGAYSLLKIDEGLPDVEKEEESEEEEEHDQGRGLPEEVKEPEKEGEGTEGAKTEEGEEWPENEVKELKGEGEVVFLRTFTMAEPPKPVVPEEALLEKGLAKASEGRMGQQATFDLEKGGVDLVVLILRPQLLIVKGGDGEETKKIPFLPDEKWVRGMAKRAVRIMAEGSVVVAVAPATMPHAWLEGLECIPSAWTFGVLGKVSTGSNYKSVAENCRFLSGPLLQHRVDVSSSGH